MKIYIVITALLGLSISMLIFWLIRKDHLHIKYAFSWIIIAILSALLGFFPGMIDYISAYFEIGYPPILAVILALSFLLIKMLIMDIERSRQSRQLIRLNQRIAILEAGLKQACNKQTTSTQKDEKL